MWENNCCKCVCTVGVVIIIVCVVIKYSIECAKQTKHGQNTHTTTARRFRMCRKTRARSFATKRRMRAARAFVRPSSAAEFAWRGANGPSEYSRARRFLSIRFTRARSSTEHEHIWQHRTNGKRTDRRYVGSKIQENRIIQKSYIFVQTKMSMSEIQQV